ncbi:MAG: hypothetical protein ACLS4Y_01370 [Faecalibacterium sp.]
MAKHMGAKDVLPRTASPTAATPTPMTAKRFLADLQAKLDELGIGKIASVSGRYYAMDRDNNWDREEKAYAAFVYGEGNHAANAAEAIEASYAADKTDEFVLPCVTCEGRPRAGRRHRYLHELPPRPCPSDDPHLLRR